MKTHRIVAINEATDDLSIGVSVLGREVGKGSDRCVAVIRQGVDCTSPDLVRLRVSLDLEIGDNPKVVQPAFESEEQVRIGILGNSPDFGIPRSDHSILNDIIRSQSMFIGDPRISTTQENTGYANGGEPTSEDVETIANRTGVDVLPLETCAKCHCRYFPIRSWGGKVGNG